MVNIAVLGYGVVGSGVTEVLRRNRNIIDKSADRRINLKYVLDKRNFEGDYLEKLITQDFNDILEDESVEIVVEVMGGLSPAYEYVKSALMNGKSVVTSNKELVAKHGTELLDIAKRKNINFLFEASAGGGIPIIRTIKEGLTSDDILKIEGILNGTTNYILTKMTKDGANYADVLQIAKEKGYAESDPTDDVEGFDAVRKLSILLSLITGKEVNFEDISTEGISKITGEDIAFAKAVDGVIKLIAFAEKSNDGYVAYVAPKILKEENPLASINNAFNAVLIHGNTVGELMFYGRGAGKLPTASAVVGDIVNIARHKNVNIGYYWSSEKQEVLSGKNKPANNLILIEYNDKEKSISKIKELFNYVEDFIELEEFENKLGFIGKEDSQTKIDEKLEELQNYEFIKEITSKLKIEL